VPHEPAKQVSAEETFDRDLDATADVRRELLRLAERVAGRLRDAKLAARTITVKVRFANFRTITRARTLGAPTDAAATLSDTVRDLYDRLSLVRPRIRLLGVAASGLVTGEPAEQLRLGERPDRWRTADRAMDTLRQRFGGDAVDRAALADRRRASPSPPRRREDPPTPGKGRPR